MISAENKELPGKEIEVVNEINPLQYGAVGDGVTDDTVSLQETLRICSIKGWICKIPKNKTFLVTSSIYLWGNSSLIGEDDTSVIKFYVKNSPYLLNIGISGRNVLEKPFSGEISKVNFNISGGKGGRIIFLWRTDGARIIDNTFDVGNYKYSATSSGNDNSWVKNGFLNTIRKNIIIKRNNIIAKANYIGSEGIGLGHFDGAVISDNNIIGVGDDPVGIHYCKNIKIINNVMKSVDGRLLVVNSENVEIIGNSHERIPSLIDNKFYKGISLIYIGFESIGKKYSISSPKNITIQDNYLYYPKASIDAGAAIYIYAPKNVKAVRNRIINDSDKLTASAIHLLPAKFQLKNSNGREIDVANVWDVSIVENISGGNHPLKIIMTGNCINYKGKVTVLDNIAFDYQQYCPAVVNENNKITRDK